MSYSPPRIGVEEEYLLLDPTTGRPAPVADRLLEVADRTPGTGRGYDLQPELLRAQVEVATNPCRTLEDVRTALNRARREVSELAETVGVVLAPLGTAPLDGIDPVPATSIDRYRDLYQHAPALVDEQLVNGMHVHVEVPCRDMGITVMNRLRPWLHVLLALSANSPIWRGRDTGFASWRAVHARRWPVHGTPPAHTDLEAYQRRTAALVERKVIRDAGQLYWSMRLSDRYPTVEVRVSDVQLDVDGAVMISALVRALVARALRDAAIGVAEPKVSSEAIDDATWHAARHGAASQLLDLAQANPDNRPRAAIDVVAALLQHVAPSRGDELDDVMPTLARQTSRATTSASADQR